MSVKAKQGESKDKPKAQSVSIGTLAVLGAYQKTFSTGSNGWFGKVQDTITGKRYQIIGAVELK